MQQPLPKAATLNVPQAFAQALALHQKGRLGDAEALYAQVLAARPDHIDALQMMGLVKLAKGRPAEALNLITAAMKARAPSPKLLLNHGLVLNALARHDDGSARRALGRMDEALAGFDRALKLRPNYVKAHNNRGAVLEVKGDTAGALACYEKALALDPRFVEARNNRVRVLCLLDRFDEALALFAQALAEKPDDVDTYLNRGRVRIDLNRNDEAADDFTRALALRPDFIEARVADVCSRSCRSSMPTSPRSHAAVSFTSASCARSARMPRPAA